MHFLIDMKSQQKKKRTTLKCQKQKKTSKNISRITFRIFEKRNKNRSNDRDFFQSFSVYDHELNLSKILLCRHFFNI